VMRRIWAWLRGWFGPPPPLRPELTDERLAADLAEFIELRDKVITDAMAVD